jgi:hypothetical protein
MSARFRRIFVPAVVGIAALCTGVGSSQAATSAASGAVGQMRSAVPAEPAVPAAAAGGPARPSAPAAPPTWKLVAGWGNKVGVSDASSIASTGKNVAFAVGPYCVGSEPCQPSSLETLHWNGAKWLPIAPPSGLTTATTSLSTAVVGASGPKNAWVFAMLSTATSSPADALHWTGKHWSVTKLGSSLQITSTAVFSAKNAWAFGTSVPAGKPYSIRYNGSKWQAVHPPAEPQALSAPAANDMWAIGPTTATATKPVGHQKLVAIHFNGTSWSTLALPKVSKPSGDYVVPGSILALGPKNVWEAYQLGNFGSCCFFGGLEHWNGAKWTAVTVPTPPQHLTGPASLAADGHGGLWLLAETGTSKPIAFYHLSGGHWTLKYPPTLVGLALDPVELTWIPGTQFLWAGGRGDYADGGVAGVILSYGTP